MCVRARVFILVIFFLFFLASADLIFYFCGCMSKFIKGKENKSFYFLQTNAHSLSLSHFVSVCLFACLPVCLSVCLSVCLLACLHACLSVCLPPTPL